MSPGSRALLTSLLWPAQPTSRWWLLETTSAVSSGEKEGGGQIDLCCELGMMVVHKVFLTVIHFRVKIDCKIPSNEIMKIQQH